MARRKLTGGLAAADENGSSQTISVEVACATPEKQRIIELNVPCGTTAREALQQSTIHEEFPGLDISACAIGVFGDVVADNQPLKENDRVEVYRPLINDPREARRTLANKGATMGGKGSAKG